MDSDEVRRLMAELEGRVRLETPGQRTIVFDAPDASELVAEGFEPGPVRRMLASAWWPEMLEEVVETPAFCGKDETPEEVLRYARDVVVEYIRKRFQP